MPRYKKPDRPAHQLTSWYFCSTASCNPWRQIAVPVSCTSPGPVWPAGYHGRARLTAERLKFTPVCAGRAPGTAAATWPASADGQHRLPKADRSASEDSRFRIELGERKTRLCRRRRQRCGAERASSASSAPMW